MVRVADGTGTWWSAWQMIQEHGGQGGRWYKNMVFRMADDRGTWWSGWQMVQKQGGQGGI